MTLDDCYGTHWYCLLLTVCIRILDICGPGLVVKGGDSESEGCEFKSWRRILDGHFSH